MLAYGRGLKCGTVVATVECKRVTAYCASLSKNVVKVSEKLADGIKATRDQL